MLISTDYFFAWVLSFTVTLLITPVIIWWAKSRKILDYPSSKRKIHMKPMPLLGGLAVFLGVNSILALYFFFSSAFEMGNLLPKHLLGVLIGSVILMVGGYLDDKKNLKPLQQILFPFAAISVVIISGIGINSMTNIIGDGVWQLDTIKTTLLWYDGLPYRITLFADIFTFVWMFGMIYTTKLLDGLDGLVSGIGVIGGLFIFITAVTNDPVQGDVALLAILFIGSLFSFLLFNFNPASIFLGEGGSTYVGFMLGVLSIISGSKVAVTLLLMGIPVLDVSWTIVRRLWEGKNPFRAADRKHLHHRLLDAGMSVRQAVLFLYALALIFGIAILVLQPMAFGVLIVGIIVLLAFILVTASLYKGHHDRQQGALDEK